MTTREESLCRFIWEKVLVWEFRQGALCESYWATNSGKDLGATDEDFPLTPAGIIEHVIPAMQREGYSMTIDDRPGIRPGFWLVNVYIKRNTYRMFVASAEGKDLCLTLATAFAKAKGWKEPEE